MLLHLKGNIFRCKSNSLIPSSNSLIPWMHSRLSSGNWLNLSLTNFECFGVCLSSSGGLAWNEQALQDLGVRGGLHPMGATVGLTPLPPLDSPRPAPPQPLLSTLSVSIWLFWILLVMKHNASITSSDDWLPSLDLTVPSWLFGEHHTFGNFPEVGAVLS